MSSSPLNLLSQLFSGFGGWESSKDDSIALVCTSTGTTPKLLAWWARYHLDVLSKAMHYDISIFLHQYIILTAWPNR